MKDFFGSFKNITSCWLLERDHLKKPWEIDANAEKNNRKKEHEEAFCLLGLVAAVLYLTSQYFVWWDFGGITIQGPKIGV